MSTERWIADGDLLYYGDGVDEWVKFPGAPAYAARLAERHNAALDVLDAQLADVMRAGDMEHARNVTLVERAERAEASAAPLRAAATDLISDLVLLRHPDESTLWRLGGQPLERDYQALKAALADDAGATLQAELAAARAVVAAARPVVRAYPFPNTEPLDEALAAYDAATKGTTT